MKKCLPVCAAFFSTLLTLTGCRFGLEQVFYRKMPVEDRASELTVIEPEGNAGAKSEYSFVIISDVHYGAVKKPKDQEFVSFIADMETRPDFCISLGDIAEFGAEEDYTGFCDGIVEPLEELGIKTYNIVGNHDLYNNGWEHFTKYCYPYTSFYKFVIGDISYYFLDSASGNLSKPQFTALKKAFKDDSNKKFVFSHIPLYAEDTTYFVMQDSQERNELISLFEKNNVMYYIGGHIHYYRYTAFDSFQELNIPAFNAQSGWTIFTVDTEKETVSFQTWLEQFKD